VDTILNNLNKKLVDADAIGDVNLSKQIIAEIDTYNENKKNDNNVQINLKQQLIAADADGNVDLVKNLIEQIDNSNQEPVPRYTNEPTNFMSPGQMQQKRIDQQTGERGTNFNRLMDYSMTGQMDVENYVKPFENLKEFGSVVGDVFTGNARETKETQTLPEFGSVETGTTTQNNFKMAAGLLASVSPEAKMDIIKNALPETTFRYDEKNNTIVTLPNGNEAILNKPGMSTQDSYGLIAQILAFIPAIKLGQIINVAKPLVVGGASALTDVGLQKVEEFTGSKQPFDKYRTIIAGGAGTASEALMPMQRIARNVKKPLPEGQSKEIIEAGEAANVPVYTSDIMPPQNIVTKLLQGANEKIPIFGTGGMRASQQIAREDSIQAFAAKYNIDLDTPLEENIVKNLDDVQKANVDKAYTFRQSASTKLDKFGEIAGPELDNLINVLAQESDKLTVLASSANKPSLNFVNAAGSDVIGANFTKIAQVRSNVIDALEALKKQDYTNLPSGATRHLQTMKTALDNTLSGFAKKTDPAAFQQWRKGNRIFVDEFSKMRQTAIKRIFNTGDATPESVFTVLNSGKRSDLKTLYFSLDKTGRANARAAIIQKGYQIANQNADNTTSGVFNPAKMATFFQKENTRKAINVFFRGDEKTVINGFTKLLKATQQAQKAGVTTPTGQSLQVLGTGGAMGAAGLAGLPVLISALTATSSIASLGRLMQSAPIRNLLVKLNAAPEGSQQFDRVLRRLMPLINGTLQQQAKEQELNQKLKEQL
tara:strand:+ start:557 stop:2857 length:2301 start_codon:yes stop_codon:yes gene_type:complete